VKLQAKNKRSKPPQQALKSVPTDSDEVDIGGQAFDINLIMPAAPGLGSAFLPRGMPLPPKTFVPRKFAREIEEHRTRPGHEDEPGEPTCVFQSGVSYLLDSNGCRFVRNVPRQTAEMMAQARADELLREQEAEKREAIEKEQWFQQKLDDEFALSQAKMRCLNEMHQRRLEAEEFLAAERAQQEEQERAEQT